MTLSLAYPAQAPALRLRPWLLETTAREGWLALAERLGRWLHNAIGIGAKSQQARGSGAATCEAQALAGGWQDPAHPAELDPGAQRVFTDYLLSLDPSGEPPGEQAFEAVWNALGQLLRTELIRRGLWQRPPSYLGVYGHSRWSERGSRPGQGDALEGLLADCYAAIFIHRQSSLLVQLKTKPHVEWLVVRAVKNFLHDLQKKHDRFGFRVFKILQAAIKGALSRGELHVIAGDARIRNTTALGVSPEVDPESLSDHDLEPIVESWNDSLLPELVTANAKARKRVIADLRGLLLSLPAHGVDGFFVQQVIEPLKNDARARWHAMLEVEKGDTAIESDDEGLIRVVRKVYPDDGVEQRDRFAKLSACVVASLDHLPAPAQTRADLKTLWEYLCTCDESAAGQASNGRMVTTTTTPGSRRLPSVREIARQLGISRGRLPALFKELEGLVSACLETITQSAPRRPAEGGGKDPRRSARRERLL